MLIDPRLDSNSSLLQHVPQLVVLSLQRRDLAEELFAFDDLLFQYKLEVPLEHHLLALEHRCHLLVDPERTGRLCLLRIQFVFVGLLPSGGDPPLLRLNLGHLLIQSGENALDHVVAALIGRVHAQLGIKSRRVALNSIPHLLT